MRYELTDDLRTAVMLRSTTKRRDRFNVHDLQSALSELLAISNGGRIALR
jgi:hypothetical protein